MLVLIEIEELKQIIGQIVRSEIQDFYKSKSSIDELSSVDELLNFKGIQRLLGLSRPTLFKRIADGSLPVKRLGRRLFFSRVEIFKALDMKKKKF